MDLNSPPPPGAEPPTASSLAGRMSNIFVAPGEAFTEIKPRPAATGNWLAPLILSIIVAWISVGLIYSQDFARQQMADMQEAAMRKQLQKVGGGRMTEQQIEQALERGGRIGYLATMIGGFVGAPFAIAGGLFLGGLVLWLLGAKALKGPVTYMKAVEILGLSSLIATLGNVVRTLLVLVMGNLLVSPSLTLLLKDINPLNPMFSLLSLVNVFSLWELGVITLGLAKIAGASFGRAAAWVFGIWFVAMGGLTGIGILYTRLFMG